MTNLSLAAAVPMERRECAGRFCEVEFIPKKPDQIYCGRKCSFKALRYSKHRNLWHGAVERYGYEPKYGRDDDDY